MCDDDNCLTLHQLFKGFLNQEFILRVAERRCLIQHDDRRVFDNGPRNGNSLALAAREMDAFGADHRVIPVGQFGDKLVALSRFRRRNHLFLTGRRVAHTDIIQNALLEQENILEHKADMVHQVILRHIAHIYAADGNAAGRYIPKPGNQIGNRTLATAGRPNNGRDLTLLCNKRNILQRLFVCISRVGKADILESNIIIGGFLGMARFWHFRNI